MKNKDLASLFEISDTAMANVNGGAGAVSVTPGNTSGTPVKGVPIGSTSNLEDTPNNDTFADCATTISTSDSGEDNDSGSAAFWGS